MSHILDSIFAEKEGGFGKDVKILMMDGSVKKASEIKIGDILVGDDGHERIVEWIFSGETNLYEIRQKSGQNYVVHGKHKLVLKSIDIDTGIEMDIEINPEQYCSISEPLKDLLLGLKVNPRGEMKVNEIKIIPAGWGTYYGFLINGGNKFVGEDFTVFNSF